MFMMPNIMVLSKLVLLLKNSTLFLILDHQTYGFLPTPVGHLLAGFIKLTKALLHLRMLKMELHLILPMDQVVLVDFYLMTLFQLLELKLK